MNRKSKELLGLRDSRVLSKVVLSVCREYGVPKISIEEKKFSNPRVVGRYSRNHRLFVRSIIGEVVVHELIHHVQANLYSEYNDCHGCGFQLAKKRVIGFMNRRYLTNFSGSEFGA